VWSPQLGKVAMHLPERWGILQFSSSASPRNDEVKIYYEEWDVRCCAMALYYAEKEFFNKVGQYTDQIEKLNPFFKPPFPLHSDADVHIKLTEEGFVAKAALGLFTAAINQERYLVVSPPST
jgi:hypothetical protein